MDFKKVINKIPDKYWYIFALTLIFPALLINLGLLTFNEDEAIRALVALEMKYSGNLIVPTLNGTYYYFKPPLYNWIILFFYNLLHDTSPWTARFVTIVNLLAFTFTVFLINKKYLNAKQAILIALIYITCGRIIFWDSMLAYIDISYSWITYMEIMSIYIFYKKKNYWALFLISYLLMSVGFLMKGYTSLPFQGLSLIAFFIWKKDFKKLFSLPNFTGLALFFLIIGIYYYAYNQYNDIMNTVGPLLDQSVRRTAIHQRINILQTIKHIFTYPFENLYHFLPWSLMAIYLFSRKNVLKIFKNEFVAFNALMFFVNIIVYWLSVEVYPRYILMLMPMLFTVFVYLHESNKEENSIYYRVLIFLFNIVFIAVFIFSFTPYWVKAAHLNGNFILKTLLLNIFTLFLSIVFYFKRENKLIILILLVLVVRIGYDWFVITGRYRENPDAKYKRQTISVANKYKTKDIFLYKKSKVDYTASYYIARVRGKITTREFNEFLPQNYYYFDTSRYDLDTNVFKITDEFMVREFNRKIYVVNPKKRIIEDN